MSTDATGTPDAQRPSATQLDVDGPASTISRDTAAAIAQRAGAAAVMYYPEIHVDDLTFSLGDEIRWCLEGVDGLDAEDERILRDVIARTIIDPTAHRSKFNEVLDILTDDPKA